MAIEDKNSGTCNVSDEFKRMVGRRLQDRRFEERTFQQGQYLEEGFKERRIQDRRIDGEESRLTDPPVRFRIAPSTFRATPCNRRDNLSATDATKRDLTPSFSGAQPMM